jgi:predicted PurR-regulated permease PerM
VQKVVGISSFVVILAILVGLQLAGFWGLILAVPLAVLLMECIADLKKRRGMVAEKKPHG